MRSVLVGLACVLIAVAAACVLAYWFALLMVAGIGSWNYWRLI